MSRHTFTPKELATSRAFMDTQRGCDYGPEYVKRMFHGARLAGVCLTDRELESYGLTRAGEFVNMAPAAEPGDPRAWEAVAP
jgi:hypothetical protein